MFRTSYNVAHRWMCLSGKRLTANTDLESCLSVQLKTGTCKRDRSSIGCHWRKSVEELLQPAMPMVWPARSLVIQKESKTTCSWRVCTSWGTDWSQEPVIALPNLPETIALTYSFRSPQRLQYDYGEAWTRTISNPLPLLRETCCPTFMPGSHSCLASSDWTSWSCSSSMQLPFNCTSPHKFASPSSSSSKSIRFSGSIPGTYKSMSSMKSGSNSMMPLPYFITAAKNQGLRFKTKFKIHPMGSGHTPSSEKNKDTT